MRLIDADKLKKHYSWWEGGSQEMTLDEAKKTIDTIVDLQPTVYEQSDGDDVEFVEVVRCEDCKKYIPCQKLPIGTSKWCDLFDRATCEMNYCGWGERREDESGRD